MKAIFWLMILGLAAPVVRAQTNLTGLLQQGMLEEQANRNLSAAIADYEALSTQFDKDRQLAATAIFRLGECYREEGQTNQAAIEYRRILNEFPDQKTLAMLSRQDLAGMGIAASLVGETTGNSPANNSNAEIWNKVKNLKKSELEKVLPTLVPDPILTSLLQQRNTTETTLTQKRLYLGPANPEITTQKAVLDTINLQISQRIDGIMEALKLQSAATPGETAGSETSVPDDEDQEIAHLQEMLKNSPDLINATGPGGWPPLVAAANSDHLRVAQVLLDHNADVNVQSRLGTPLVAAAAGGHKAMVELLLKHGADIQAKDTSFGQTALHFAASRGFEAVTETLLAAHPDVNAQNNNGETPLFLAAANGNTRIIQMLLAAGGNPNAKDSNGNAVLTRALSGSPNTVKILLAAGADANATNNDGRTLLSIAAELNGPEIVKPLLDAKADPNVGTVDAPLLCAVGAQDTTSAERLLQAGANPNVNGVIRGHYKNFNTDGHYTPLWSAISMNQLPMVQLLLKYKADPNDSQTDNRPVIFSAVDKPKILQALLDAGANPNVTNDNGQTPLSFAAGLGSPEAIRLLLAAKADPNGGTFDAPLLRAIDRQDLATAELLLQGGADPNAVGTMHCPQGSWGSRFHSEFSGIGRLATPLWLATESHQFPMVQLLLKYKANPNDSQIGDTPAIFWALSNTNVLRALLDGGANPNVRGGGDYGHETPLISAIRSGNIPTMTILLNHGADPNFGVSEVTPLRAATESDQFSMVQLLLKYKANPNDSQIVGTPVIFSALSKTNILQALLDAGANPNGLGRNGDSPLADAAFIESSGSVAILLKHGANPNLGRLAPNPDTFPPGSWPVYLAAYRLNEGILRLLLDYGANPNVQDWHGKTPLKLVDEFVSGNRHINSSSRSPDEEKTIAASMADLLRQHGAMEVLPDWDHITITSPSGKNSVNVFSKGTNNWNRFTLFEFLNWASWRFPMQFSDFAHVTIVRPSATGEVSKKISINLLNSTNGVDCSRDVPLEFGDVVQIPEREHTLAELDMQTHNLIAEMADCLREKAGTATLIVDGRQTIQLPLKDFVQPGLSCIHALLSSIAARNVLTSDSDLSRVKVTRGEKTWIVDCSNQGYNPFTDLWVRDGDVIEVPEAK